MVKNLNISNSKTEAARLAAIAELEISQEQINAEDIGADTYSFARSEVLLRVTKYNFETFFMITTPVILDPQLFALAKKASEALEDIEQYLDMKISSLE
ncbi:hypothetical protein ASD54_10965 [Rhizobium sp. Root149]|uniref:hypothetical protein n=1 Tax=Rhizobium sp. Root149 TaxID=1736473 RepID=UPI000715A257|nr:hypothetical protein [Rhizobium sp. Root149]KQZ50722.1 hypothetical protein ASD54_10965 [Rhizobium sp. Root149]